jgi:hypothetical protein
MATSSWVSLYVTRYDVVAVDEAACAVEIRVLIDWKPDKPLILVADLE